MKATAYNMWYVGESNILNIILIHKILNINPEVGELNFESVILNFLHL